ncbi:MAG: alanine--tRNA ligase-related protein [Patescibacteria group bacterium]|nr:alanine--tRNA ligase-related protein [Patescibacteria group bacterium]
MFSSEEIRQKFLNFFKNKGHVIVPSSSLVPDDPSVLFTTAGMQQFKKYYTGELDFKKEYPGKIGATSVQKCFRTSDIDEVGDESHLTFFEMLGNFSFGGYWKEGAIKYAWEFLTDKNFMNISPDRIHVTVHDSTSLGRDEDSYRIWKDVIKISENKIKFGGIEDNFWGPTGSGGPCGPSTEIYVDGIEIWNIVFNEYFSKTSREESIKNGWHLKGLETRGIDTGMGLERLAMIAQSKKTIFETDLFHSLMMPDISAMGSSGRIVADHLRAIVFLIADGARPSNKEAGYVLRRLIRRAIYQSKKLRIYHYLYDFMDNIIKFYGKLPDYNDLNINQEVIRDTFKEESEKFEKGLDLGLREFGKKYPGIIAKFSNPGATIEIPATSKFISGEDAFYFHQTYGLTIDIVKDLAKNGLHRVDEEGFWREFKKHQEISRAGAEKKFGGHGLNSGVGEAKGNDKEKVVRLHTTTHLLQAALRQILGDKVSQRGSDINSERLRFDFSFDRKLTPEEIKQTEDLVNEKIKENLPVNFVELPKDEALASGALHFFSAQGGSASGGKDKYPDKVKIYFTGKDLKSAFSKEFCGGPHVKNTSELGKFKILKEEASSAGVRRIKATVL